MKTEIHLRQASGSNNAVWSVLLGDSKGVFYTYQKSRTWFTKTPRSRSRILFAMIYLLYKGVICFKKGRGLSRNKGILSTVCNVGYVGNGISYPPEYPAPGRTYSS